MQATKSTSSSTRAIFRSVVLGGAMLTGVLVPTAIAGGILLTGGALTMGCGSSARPTPGIFGVAVHHYVDGGGQPADAKVEICNGFCGPREDAGSVDGHVFGVIAHPNDGGVHEFINGGFIVTGRLA